MSRLPLALLFAFLLCVLAATAHAQPNAAGPAAIWGRWEVVEYSEQGLQVDKTQPAPAQAEAVYRHVSDLRNRYWLNDQSIDDLSRRQLRALELWSERDRNEEVSRVRQAIELPYVAVFFRDSTLALYNRDAGTGAVYFPERRQYVYDAAHQSLHITFPNAAPPYQYFQWRAQILTLTDTELILFLPEEAERVRLRRTPFSLP